MPNDSLKDRIKAAAEAGSKPKKPSAMDKILGTETDFDSFLKAGGYANSLMEGFQAAQELQAEIQGQIGVTLDEVPNYEAALRKLHVHITKLMLAEEIKILRRVVGTGKIKPAEREVSDKRKRTLLLRVDFLIAEYPELQNDSDFLFKISEYFHLFAKIESDPAKKDERKALREHSKENAQKCKNQLDAELTVLEYETRPKGVGEDKYYVELVEEDEKQWIVVRLDKMCHEDLEECKKRIEEEMQKKGRKSDGVIVNPFPDASYIAFPLEEKIVMNDSNDEEVDPDAIVAFQKLLKNLRAVRTKFVAAKAENPAAKNPYLQFQTQRKIRIPEDPHAGEIEVRMKNPDAISSRPYLERRTMDLTGRTALEVTVPVATTLGQIRTQIARIWAPYMSSYEAMVKSRKEFAALRAPKEETGNVRMRRLKAEKEFRQKLRLEMQKGIARVNVDLATMETDERKKGVTKKGVMLAEALMEYKYVLKKIEKPEEKKKIHHERMVCLYHLVVTALNQRNFLLVQELMPYFINELRNSGAEVSPENNKWLKSLMAKIAEEMKKPPQNGSEKAALAWRKIKSSEAGNALAAAGGALKNAGASVAASVGRKLKALGAALKTGYQKIAAEVQEAGTQIQEQWSEGFGEMLDELERFSDDSMMPDEKTTTETSTEGRPDLMEEWREYEARLAERNKEDLLKLEPWRKTLQEEAEARARGEKRFRPDRKSE